MPDNLKQVIISLSKERYASLLYLLPNNYTMLYLYSNLANRALLLSDTFDTISKVC